MDDVVPEAESLLHPTKLRGDEATEERKYSEAAKQEGEERASGFINHLISNLVTGGDADEVNQGGKETIPEGGKNEEKGGGLLDHIISNLVTPLSPKTGNIIQGKVEAFDARSENESGFGSEEEVGGGAGSGGGFINNIVSNLFHHSEGEVGESTEENKKEEMVKVGEENKADLKADESGGGGIIDSIVSHLPTSLPDC
ncbi:uncharacterized protein LOC111297211 [Durio zibethinus]|uniref:Uncharacterized protein LOC111297211 n=1 Tax=Durio zibethinus TaxID=66656 RepID=A0A6P5Z4F6_DURZI|nr:uncharacterized protein LOC111297211 [Durio zibethinus]